jgi:hypothetical protein
MQKVLVVKPKIEEDELEDQNVRTLKVIYYNYDECRHALAKIVIIDELPSNFVESQGFRLFTIGPCNLDLTFLLISLL